MRDKKTIDRFHAKIDKSGDCWLWTASKIKGYGYLKIKGSLFAAHRLSYEHYICEIPEGLFVCHTCDVRSCVNPNHLFLGTQKDNLVDCKNKGRNAHGERQHCAKLTDASVIEIRRVHPLKSQKELAKEYGVARKTINRVLRRESWSHI